MPGRESGGRSRRQPGQVLTEAATTIFLRVVPAPTFSTQGHMLYSEAFQKLGYRLVRPRLDWTASKDDGICVSLWKKEIDWKARPLSMSSQVRSGPLEDWVGRHGNKLRKKHLAVALKEYGGWVDAVIVEGEPGAGVDRAEPWRPEARQGLKWRVVAFDVETGHFTVETHQMRDVGVANL